MSGVLTPVTIVCEGAVDRDVLVRVLETRGLPIGPVHETGGKARLDRQLAGYVAAARFGPWVVQRDLDADAGCPSALVARLVPLRVPGLNLIVPVRQTESWLLADRAAFAAFLGRAAAAMPEDPEALADAKAEVVRLAGRSRRRTIREGMVPSVGSGRKVGREYGGLLAEFVAGSWDPDRAVIGGARSLAKFIERIERFRRFGQWTVPASG